MENQFAERLTEELKVREISKRKFAKMVGVSATTISDWTNGKIQATAENIYQTAKALELSTDYLLGLID